MVGSELCNSHSQTVNISRTGCFWVKFISPNRSPERLEKSLVPDVDYQLVKSVALGLTKTA